jgi:hypothetical protein
MTKAQRLENVLIAARKLRAGVEDRHARTRSLQEMAAAARRDPNGYDRARALEIQNCVQIVSLDEAIYELVMAIERYDRRTFSKGK